LFPLREQGVFYFRNIERHEGAIALEAQNMSKKSFYFVDLAANTAKPFDGMKAGKFTDMYGRSVEFPVAEMGAFLAGTQAAIEATKAESGEIVGLPIDMKNHEHGDAAGWIVAADLAGDVMRFTAKWTQAGLDLIGAGLQRFFSPSVDMQNKAVIGGSLTNWPATRAGGKTLLRPIELSEGVYTLALGGPENSAPIAEAFAQANPPAEDGTGFGVIDVIDGAVIVSDESGGLMKCPYTEAEGAYTFAPAAEWVKVEVEYKEVEGEPETEPEAEAQPAAAEAALPNETLATVANMSEAQIAALVDERVNERVAELARKADRARDTLAFSERVCNGTKETPVGLSVPPADLCEVLLSLPDDSEKKIRTLLEHVVSVGVVNFAERGHSGILEVKPELPAELRRHVKTWIASGKPLADFFLKVENVGKMEDYNLSEFQGAK
jgi:hypothetical protein